MRVLALLTDAYGSTGGIAAVNRDLLAAVAGAPGVGGVVVLPRVQPGPAGGVPPGVEVVEAAAGGKGRYVAALTSRLARDRAFGLVVCGHLPLLPFAALAGRVCGAPVVAVVHGLEAWAPTPHRTANRLARGLDAAVAVSELTKRRFCAWSGLDPARAAVIPNAVDPAAFVPGPRPTGLEARYGLEGKRVVLTLGRLAGEHRRKGFDRALEALPALAEAVPDVAYLVAGDGPDRARLEAKAARLGVADRVVFAGFVAEAEKADHYRLADAFALPSEGEGFGIVLLEAMACGVPVVASDADAGLEAVRGGALGAVVSPRDPAALAAALAAALRRPKAVPEGLDHFSRARFAERWHALVARLADL